MPKFYIPARDSRHRKACFALYRALQRQAAQVPLPDDVAAAAVEKLGARPLGKFVRNGFEMNRGDTSLRLVYKALENGYKFLELLAAAATPAAPEQASVAAFVRRQLAMGWQPVDRHAPTRPRKRQKKQSSLPSAPHPEAKPLLTRRLLAADHADSNTAEGCAFYEYVPTERPRPLEALSRTKTGRRCVPRLTADASGLPFLRLGKPQSPVLSRVIRQKGRKRRDRMMLVRGLQRDELPFVEEEDRWEALVAGLDKDKNQDKNQDKDMDKPSPEPAYADSVLAGIDYINGKLNLEHADMLARSRAMLQIVDAEQALADKEAKEAEEAEKAKGK